MRVLIFCLIFVFNAIPYGDGANILGFFPGFSESHLNFCNALVNELAERGHNVTTLTTFPSKVPPSNYKEISFQSVANLTSVNKQKSLIRQSMNNFLPYGLLLTEHIFNDDEFKLLLQNKKQYDIIIILMAFNEAQFVLGHYFGIPIIALNTLGSDKMVNRLTGNPSYFSYMPEILFSQTTKLAFFKRVKTGLGALRADYFYLSEQEKLMHKYFPDAPSLHTVLSSTSLVFVNSHVSMGYPRPMVPNMIEIGGFHVKPSKKLPKDLQQYLDEAPHGVVYFSMGSNFPTEKCDAFLKFFSRLKQKVLWQREEDFLPGQPSNLKLGKWLPQQDILAHPNVKVFISPGDLLSTTEAVAFGVPMIGIPLFGDDEFVTYQASTLGYSILLEYDNITIESITWALNEALYNRQYVENIKERSMIWNNQADTPMERAVFWVEYVARHKGAPHLRSAAVDLNFVQYLLLDVLAFTLSILVILFYAPYYVGNKIWKRIKRQTKVKNE